MSGVLGCSLTAELTVSVRLILVTAAVYQDATLESLVLHSIPSAIVSFIAVVA